MTILPSITQAEFAALEAVKMATEKRGKYAFLHFQAQEGWLTVTEIREHANVQPTSNIRPSLIYLSTQGLLNEKTYNHIRHFKMTAKGAKLLEDGLPEIDEQVIVDSSSWTGIVEPVQVKRVLLILADMEDVCEGITSNRDRAQILGLIRAMELLLTIPEPPRQGVVALIRDPAFANIVQVGTFLAALIAAVRP